MDFKDDEMTFKDASHVLELIREECMKRPDLVKEEYRTEMQQTIVDGGELYREPERPEMLAGHCYVASEAFHHLVGGSPHFVRVNDMIPHWYIVLGEAEGRRMVADPTVEQFTEEPPYGEGIGKGFLTTEPSERAQEIIQAVEERL